MKPLRRLFFRITSFANLLAAARRAQRGKRYRPDVLAFHANLEAELLLLQQQLRIFSYQPGPYRRFTIRDPKPRLISAAPYRDRVVHHALFADSPEPLRQARCLVEAELAALRLRLHPIKSQIRRCGDGASFVGFFVMPGLVRVRNHNLRKGRRRLRLQAAALAAGQLPSATARASLRSWNAHLAHGHTWRLRRRLFRNLPYGEGLLG